MEPRSSTKTQEQKCFRKWYPCFGLDPFILGEAMVAWNHHCNPIGCHKVTKTLTLDALATLDASKSPRFKFHIIF